MILTTLTSDNLSLFRNNLSEGMQKWIVTIEDKVRNKKLQYDMNREAAKISALSLGKINEYDYLTG